MSTNWTCIHCDHEYVIEEFSTRAMPSCPQCKISVFAFPVENYGSVKMADDYTFDYYCPT